MPGPNRRSDSASASSEDMLAKNARQLTRMVEMFWSPLELLALGRRMRGLNAQGDLQLRETASDKTKRLLRLLDCLCDLDPKLIPRSMQGGTNVGVITRDAKKQLGMGQSNGKSEDMRKVKENMPKWMPWNPPLPDADDKLQRGMNHNECAFLLSDPTVDWTDLEAKTQFVSFDNPPMSSSLWGCFLWSQDQYNPNHTSDGLMKGELLVKATQAILFSPVVSKVPLRSVHKSTSGARGNKCHGTIGNAKTYQSTEVTPAFIAYVAVVVRHSLTSDEIFSDNCGGFDYIDFYNQIREYLESSAFKKCNVALIKWWNKQLFSEYRFGRAPDPTEGRINGTLANLEAEMEGSDEEDELDE